MDHPGLDERGPALRIDLDHPVQIPGVDDDALPYGVSGDGGPRPAHRHRNAEGLSYLVDSLQLVHMPGTHHRERDHAVEAGIR